MQKLLTFIFAWGIIFSCDTVIGMSNEIENNSGPGGLAIPTSGENRSPIATGTATFSNRKSKGGIIYKATNLVNGKCYIGKTCQSFHRRKSRHITDAIADKSNSPLHRSMRKYNIENFKWEIVDCCIFPDMLCELEKHYIKKFNCKAPSGYNLTDGGEGMFGFSHSKETRERISIAHIGNKYCLGKLCSEETKKKIGVANKGKVRSKELRLRLSAACSGWHHTEETKKKLSARFSGKNHPNYGKKFSEELRKKLSNSHKGKRPWNFGLKKLVLDD